MKERETGIEPATLSLARRCSTAEPLALNCCVLMISHVFLTTIWIITYAIRTVNNYLKIFYNFLFYAQNRVSGSLHTLLQFLIRDLSSEFYNGLFLVQINLGVHLSQSI